MTGGSAPQSGVPASARPVTWPRAPQSAAGPARKIQGTSIRAATRWSPSGIGFPKAGGQAREKLIPEINGRPVISRAGMAARGVPAGTASRWYRDRASNGHPERAGRIGRTDYWYEDEWTAWRQQHDRGRLESLTRPDRDGDPDELVDAEEAARILGYASRRVIHANRRLGCFPQPDSYGTARNGRPAPLWKRSAVWAVADGRFGIGGSRNPRTPHGPSKPHPTRVTRALTPSSASCAPGASRRRTAEVKEPHTSPNAAVKTGSRSWIRNRSVPRRSSRSMARLRACCTAHAAVGRAVTRPGAASGCRAR